MKKKVKRLTSNYAAKNKKKQIKISDLQKLNKIRDNVAGIDVGSEYHFVAAPDPKHQGKVIVNRFGSFTSNIKECVDWLKSCNIVSVAMEATGIYWTILHDMLVEAGIEVVLINPRDLKKREKKTDVCDAEYLQLYHSYGLCFSSMIPEKNIRELRTYTRLREQSVIDCATCIQRMQKALINMNLRLDNVLSDLSGVTGINIVEAILRGERDPAKLAEYRDRRCKKTYEEIEDSLRGFYQEDHLFALDRALRQYKFHFSEIQKCDEMIENKLTHFETSIHYSEENNIGRSIDRPIKRKKVTRSHEFSFDLRSEISRIAGVDLTCLPGIGPSTALALISETGTDMSRWPSMKHFTSWLGLSPNNKISGGKVLGRRSKRAKKKIAIILRMAVSGLHSEANDTAIGAFFRRKRAQMGSPKAITAAACKLARMYYMTMSTGKPYVELGAQAYYELQKEKYLKRVRKQVSRWGYELTQANSPEKIAVESS